MNVDLKGLPVGEWRDLKPKELELLFEAIKDSSSEAPVGRKTTGRKTSQRRAGAAKSGKPSGSKHKPKAKKAKAKPGYKKKTSSATAKGKQRPGPSGGKRRR